jgi:hypothetical protein
LHSCSIELIRFEFLIGLGIDHSPGGSCCRLPPARQCQAGDPLSPEAEALSCDDGLRAVAHRAMAFMVEEPARYQLLFHRTIPGFTPSPGSYAVSVQQLDRTQAWFDRNGYGAPGALDLFTSLIGGLAGQQIANDPGGDRWTSLVDAAVDMFLTHIKATSRNTTRRARERTRS